MAVQNEIQTGFQEGESNIKSFQLETCPRSFHTFQLLYRIPKLLLFRCSTKFWRIFGNKSWTFCFSLSEQSNLRIKRVSASCRQKQPSRLSTLEKTNLKQFFTLVFIVVWRSSVKKITMTSCEKMLFWSTWDGDKPEERQMTISHSPGTKTNYSVMALSMMSPNFFLSLFFYYFYSRKGK